MEKSPVKVEITCSIIFFICALLCVALFILYDYVETPQIELIGDKKIVLEIGVQYEEQGAKAFLNNKDVSSKIKINNLVNPNKVGTYNIEYSITNSKGRKKRTVKRMVTMQETEKPVLKLTKGLTIKVQYGSKFTEPGYTAIDNYDGDISGAVEVQGIVDTKQLGTYKLYYTVTDSSGNVATADRTVNVVDTAAPKISLNGSSYVVVAVKGNYEEEGYIAIDNYDGDVTNKVKKSGKINYNIPGYYKTKYSVTDSFGNKSTITRTIQVGTKRQIDDANQILISVKEQKLWFYKNGVLELTSNVVTGTKGKNDTPKGSFRIQGKSKNVYLQGADYKTFVSYWIPIYGDIGLHDATWRNSFGGYIYQTSGSHGCINLPYSTAEKIYYNAPIGTRVKVV